MREGKPPPRGEFVNSAGTKGSSGRAGNPEKEKKKKEPFAYPTGEHRSSSFITNYKYMGGEGAAPRPSREERIADVRALLEEAMRQGHDRDSVRFAAELAALECSTPTAYVNRKGEVVDVVADEEHDGSGSPISEDHKGGDEGSDDEGDAIVAQISDYYNKVPSFTVQTYNTEAAKELSEVKAKGLNSERGDMSEQGKPTERLVPPSRYRTVTVESPQVQGGSTSIQGSNPPNNWPDRKIASSVGGSIIGAHTVAYLWQHFTGSELPPLVAIDICAVIGGIIGWAVPWGSR